MNQSEFLAITCNSLEAREKPRVQGGIASGFTSHWLKNWRESFKPITKRSNRNHVITFDSHLKTALKYLTSIIFLHSAILMVLAWVGFATLGMFIARYMRPVWGEKEIFGKRIWFVVSQNVNLYLQLQFAFLQLVKSATLVVQRVAFAMIVCPQ